MMEDIKDIHVPFEFPLWGWIAIGVAMLLIIVGMYLLRLSQKPAVVKEPEVPKRSASEIALEDLEVLYAKQFSKAGLFKEFYGQLSDIVRHYLENRFAIRAPEMTTEEFLIFAQTSTLLSDEHKHFLRDFLNGCDMVKFAKHLPSVNDAEQNFTLAKKLITETTTHGI